MKLVTLLFIPLLSFGNIDKGWEIALKMKESQEGFVGESSEMKLELISKDGSRVTRKMKGFSLEGDEVDKSLMIFTHPADVNGTKLLTWSHQSKDDSQWLYLTSIRRVKKISSRSKGSSFMGSEFSFEDLSGQAIEKYTFNLIEESEFEGNKIWKLERVSKKKSSYSKTILYVDQMSYIALKSEYYNKRSELKKYALSKSVKKYRIGKKNHYRANSIEMINVLNGKKSIFSWINRKIGVSNEISRFNKNSLKI